jgi:hypothetical protein
MLGSDFVPTVLKHGRYCDCGRKMNVGESYLASIKYGKIQKWVCSEDCRLEFDARVWAGIARKNSLRRASK